MGGYSEVTYRGGMSTQGFSGEREGYSPGPTNPVAPPGLHVPEGGDGLVVHHLDGMTGKSGGHYLGGPSAVDALDESWEARLEVQFDSCGVHGCDGRQAEDRLQAVVVGQTHGHREGVGFPDIQAAGESQLNGP